MTESSYFVRKASGLVRDISTFDAFTMNIAFMSIAGGLITYTSAEYVFPGGDVIMATLLCTVFTVCQTLLYAMFTQAMPRSGGDYIFVSRVLHPALGFIVNFASTTCFLFYAGIVLSWVTTLAMSPSIMIVGTVMSDQGLVGLANNLTIPLTVVIIGVVLTIFFALLMLKGTKLIVLSNSILVIMSIVGLLVAAGLLVINNNTDFINAFSRFGQYQDVITAAHNAGYSTQSSNPLYSTLGIMPLVFVVLGYSVVTSFFAGELKTIKKGLIVANAGAVVFAGVIMAILGALALRVFGYDFLGSMAYLQATGASQYPFGALPPYLNLYVSLLTSNTFILWLLGITFVAGWVLTLPPTFMMGTRCMFAWSFDRVVPERLSRVNNTLHSPLYAVLVTAVGFVIGLLLVVYGPGSTLLAMLSAVVVGEVVTFACVAIAAIVFPLRQKRMFEASAANNRFAGIPVISILGGVCLPFFILLLYFYATNPAYGATTTLVETTLAVLWIVPAVIYVASYYYHKSRGIDITLSAKEIPPL
ncbi:MAG: APC family permease [Candidatus Bathyarchaeia archaeon]|jgi:amino acid transporter